MIGHLNITFQGCSRHIPVFIGTNNVVGNINDKIKLCSRRNRNLETVKRIFITFSRTREIELIVALTLRYIIYRHITCLTWIKISTYASKQNELINIFITPQVNGRVSQLILISKVQFDGNRPTYLVIG